MPERKRKQMPRHIRWLVCARDGDACVFCGASGELHVDHVVPWSAGGEDGTWNLRPLCPRCNLSRHTSATPDDHTTRPPVGLTCTDCAPTVPASVWGFCYRCRQYGDVSQVDQCPDPRRCNCYDMRYYARRHRRQARRRRRRRQHART